MKCFVCQLALRTAACPAHCVGRPADEGVFAAGMEPVLSQNLKLSKMLLFYADDASGLAVPLILTKTKRHFYFLQIQTVYRFQRKKTSV